MIIEKVIRKLKGNPDYKWESNYSFYDLFLVMFQRFKQLVKGYFLKIFLKTSSGFLFVGRRVCVRHKNHLSVGKNLILEDNVYINALSYNGITIGDNVSIARGSTLQCTGVIAQKGVGITIKNGVGITAGAFLGGQGGIEIGENVIMGPGVKIFSENHNFSDLNLPIKDQGVTRKAVKIGDNCWLGSGVTVLAGVTIGNGCVIAAGSIVSKSVPDNVIVAGIPGKIIKTRNEEFKSQQV